MSWLDCDVRWKVDFIRQPATTSSVVGPRRSSRALPKTKLAPKKVMVTVWWSVAGLIHYSFLHPGKTMASEKYAQQINEMYWKTSVPASDPGQQNGTNPPAQHHPTADSRTAFFPIQSFPSSRRRDTLLKVEESGGCREWAQSLVSLAWGFKT